MRAFVVGNGPSLARTNLNNLIGEVTFATNNVHLIYPHTDWRTTNYVRAESALLPKPEHWKESIDVHKELGVPIWCNEHFGRYGNTITTCTHYQKHFDNPDCPHLWHLPRLCTFGSSVNVAVQLAVTLGYSPIYLVGCDLGYKDGQPSHFDPNYENGLEGPARYANMDALAAHMIASRSGYPIYNATIGGELEAFERVEFESLFQ